MRPFILLLVFFTTGKLTYCQSLYYYVAGDSVGVKDQLGKKIIPAVHRNLEGVKNHEKITDFLISLPPKWEDNTRQTWGIVYNRKGKALYAPYFYDNGPDQFEEGMTRYVENEKIGFVNRAGEIVIKAQWDYVSPFDYGIASFCNGCVWDYADDSEHPRLKGGSWGYINSKGEKLEPFKERKSDRDQVEKDGFISYQFSYTFFEKNILSFFNRQKMISKAYFVNYYSPLDSNERILRYEIVERPSSFFPYYHVKSFEFTKESGFNGQVFPLNFYISRDGKNYYFEEYFDGLIRLDTWLKKYIEEARSFIESHPDVLYKF
ncbi:MAG TPA: WG repeat-containing protein [Chitinophagaceae bacterium]